MSTIFRYALGIATLFSAAEAGDFLHAGQVNASQLEANLLAELADALRPGNDKERVKGLEGDLYQLFNTVPSESDGTLNHHVVRYVLHRFFVQRHGWFIRGLEPDGDHRDDSTQNSHALTELQEWVPSYLQGFLEQLNHGKGMGLRELAVFAATLEDMIHKEALERLELAWQALGFSFDGELSSSQVTKVLQTYMIIYDSGGNFTAQTPAQVEKVIRAYAAVAKDWSSTQAWVRKVRTEVYPQQGGWSGFTFKQVEHLVEQLGERYAAYNDLDCNKLKSELLDVEAKKVGRVRLSEFYKKGQYSNWDFTEKREYLRSLGALDESDPTQPYVIVPNYVASRPNCLVCSNFYVVCCRNECEDLMTRIESETDGHMAKPEDLLKIVTTMSTGTVKAPRRLSDTLMDRLRQVASRNKGKVPIHGRLFAQWMHHAFPRECPYPHEAGTTSPQTPDEWMKAAGHDSHKVSDADMKAHMDADTKASEQNELPWSHKEELLTRRKSPVKVKALANTFSIGGILQKLALFGVLGGMFTWVVLSARSLFANEKSRKSHYC